MAKSKERSEIEYLRGLCREQKSVIRNLKKELNRYQKAHNREQDLEGQLNEVLLHEDVEETRSNNRCPEDDGLLSVLDLGAKKYLICSKCTKRTPVK